MSVCLHFILCFHLIYIYIYCFIKKSADTEWKFTVVLDAILEKASAESMFSVSYAKLCLHLSASLPLIRHKMSWIGSTDKVSKVFRRMMILSCEKRFQSQREQVLEHIHHDDDDDMHVYCIQRFFGTMIIVGELYNQRLVHEQIILKGIFKSLLPPSNKNPKAVEIEALCKLLITCGRALDQMKSIKHLNKFLVKMRKVCIHFRTLNENKETRVGFMVDQLIEMRANDWISHHKLQIIPHHHHHSSSSSINNSSISIKMKNEFISLLIVNNNTHNLIQFCSEIVHSIVNNISFWCRMIDDVLFDDKYHTSQIDTFVKQLLFLFRDGWVHSSPIDFSIRFVSHFSHCIHNCNQTDSMYAQRLGYLLADIFHYHCLTADTLKIFVRSFKNMNINSANTKIVDALFSSLMARSDHCYILMCQLANETLIDS